MSISVENLEKELSAISDVPDTSLILDSCTSLNQLLTSDDNSPCNQGIEACKNLANALRTASLRTPLGNAQVIECLSKLLEKVSGQQPDFQLQALRVLGNLCFDNDSNRERVKNTGIISTVTSWFGTDRPDLIRTMCGFFLNSSMDYAPIQIEIAESGAAAQLIKLVKYVEEDDGTVTMAIKVIDELAAEDSARKSIATPTTVKTYLSMIQDLYKGGEYMDELDNFENVVDTLLQLVMDDDNLQNEIIDLGYLDMLLDFLENTDVLVSEQQEKEKLEDIRKTVSKIAVHATSSDLKMNALYDDQELLSRLLSMASSENEVVHQCAVYALGNLARSDEHCIELVEKYDLSKLLLNLFQNTQNATFQYAILGCLKHLCLPITNKVKIGNENCIQILTPLLDESKDMLKRNQFLTIGIIKLLCAGNYDNAVKIVEEGTYKAVVAFIKRVDDVSAKSEATRILTNLVKTIWVQNDNIDLRNQVIEAHIIEPIIELVRTSPYPILKNDGIMGLTILYSDSENNSTLNAALPLIIAEAPTTVDTAQVDEDELQQQDQKPEPRSFLQVVVDDICLENAEFPLQIRCNACILLIKVVEAARSVQQQDIITTIQSLASDRLEKIPDNSDLYKYVEVLQSILNQ